MKALLTLCFALLLAACGHVPITGRGQLQMLSAQDEMAMGLRAYRDVLKKEKLSHDAALNEQLQRVDNRIATASGRSDYRWEFKLIDDDKVVNAFCLPGGKVAVYTGLLPIAKDDAGLAAVIGHEVAHAIARHGGERVSQQLLLEGLTAVAVASTKDPQKAGLYAGLLGIGATLGVLLPYSRLHESEADRLGLIYMARAGYDPHAAVDLWRRMAENGKGKGKPPEFLSSHPVDVTRIRQIEQWLPEAMAEYRPQR